jgi:hypothetical protein
MESTILLRLITHLDGPMASLDELIEQLQSLMNTRGLAGMLSLLLRLLDRELLQAWRVGKLVPPACCARQAYEVEREQHLSIRTSLGQVPFAWHRLRCRHCHARWIPLRAYLRLAPNQRHSAELERRAIEAASTQSYRQSARALTEGGRGGAAKSTIHGWVAHTTSEELPAPDEPDAVLEADGLVYHCHPETPGGSTRCDLRVVIGLTAQDEVAIRGVWSGPSWAMIGTEMAHREGTRIAALVHDGEPGLAEGLSVAIRRRQRCHWHLATKINEALWEDHLSRDDRQVWQKALTDILAVPLPDDPTDAVQRARLRRSVRVTRQLLANLGDILQAQGAIHGATYVRRALPEVFSYVDEWLETGRRIPRTTSRMEGVMSQLKVRLKAIGRNWKGPGIVKLSSIILKQWKHGHQWRSFWARQMHLTGFVRMDASIS